MKRNRQSIIAAIAALLLLSVQFGSVLHAADHPFHVHDHNCVAYMQFEHHNPVAGASLSCLSAPVSADPCHDIDCGVLLTAYFCLPPSRAPPAYS